MSNLIGETAGKVYKFLEKSGPSTAARIERGVGGTRALVQQGIGWLAREDKVVIDRAGRTVLYALKEV